MNVSKLELVNLWNDHGDCCGCSACEAICPVDAISMKRDQQGFYYPIIDDIICIKCKKCIDVCAFKRYRKRYGENAIRIFAAKASDDIRMKSSSGGLFSVFSEAIISDGGAIVSAIYKPETYEVETSLYTDIETRNNARGSKYIQSNMKKAFTDCYLWIKNNPQKRLLFVGTGCQVAGFREYAELNRIENNIIFVDLICHGVSSPGLWEKYARELEEKYTGKLTDISFKDKRNGWHKPSVYAVINNKEVSIEGFSEWFYGRYSLRQSCYRCPYTKIERNSDITIGDYWGVEEHYPEFCDEKGVSLVIVHTEKGQLFYDSVKSEMNWIEIKKDECLQPRLLKPAPKPRQYDKFWKCINSKGLDYCISEFKEKPEKSIKETVIDKMKILR